ncbi:MULTISPECIES: sigma-70 family RNA polymerase sigma factor [unclassified Arcicella]|uniref:RNA polymerase sigma factor n=1 Tax=unclassified Arcicella TaxID=2644986 RepID=UPI0028595EAD|nr:MULTISPECIES: sigma-70 family RNA polymerase sigma factor [unclassified Arcicella]MDR6559922.1 RNA polymerase sigma-70 factor (ECF subfamily) [Arcicella sp. BE51]MDR6810471.1 RNA polymerase sigma-70 factor (ECF subfamily) [Arcicella sp. BE140]MDR6821821.1 RNA polymerase sigma-70 factor (ECF subfamily) [Arcicella sp. BE139]
MEPTNKHIALWKSFQEGDSKALGQLANNHYKILFNYATKFTKDRELIKDCIQDLFLYLWDHRETLQSSPFVTIYLLKSLRNNLFKKLNHEKRNHSDDLDSDLPFTEGINAESELIESELFVENEYKLKSILSSLPKRQQEVIFLKFYEALSIEEIADIMDMNKQSVSNLLHRAIINLKSNWFLAMQLLYFLHIKN